MNFYIEKEPKKVLINALVFIGASVSILGHYIKDKSLSALGEDNVTMKFVTAFCFICIVLGYQFKATEFFRATFYTLVFTISGYLINGVKPLFLLVFEDVAIESIKGDVPSWFTALAFFVLIGSYLRRKLKYNYLVMLMGFSCLLGHLLEVQPMYFYFENVSTGMAANTGLAFFLLSFYYLPPPKLKL